MIDTSYKHIAPEADTHIKVKSFYSVCVDNFFKHPDKFRNLGLRLEKKSDPNGRWPGIRTKNLAEIDFQLSNELILKVFSSFIDLKYTSVSWEESRVVFQEITPFSKKNKNVGWIHQDSGYDLAFLIYLTPNADINSGTSLFNIKPECIDNYVTKKQYEKEKLFKGEKINDAEYDKALADTENMFYEKTRFSNVYNRLIAYDSNEFHRANNFTTNTDKRLTLVGFVKNVKINQMPLKRVKDEKMDNELEDRISKL